LSWYLHLPSESILPVATLYHIAPAIV
jgi:hypothetical protein